MALKNKITADFIAAAKAGNKEKRGVLSMLLAGIKNAEIEKRSKSKIEDGKSLQKAGLLADEEIISVIGRQIKQRKDSAEQFKAGNRMELAEKEEKEIRTLAEYLPEQMSEEEIRRLTKAAIAKTGAASAKEMGRVMAVLMPLVKGKADGMLVSKIVKEELSS